MSSDVLVLNKDEQVNVWDFSNKLARSKMVPQIFQGKPEDVFVTVIMGRELGISPIMALSAIVVIQGTVTLKVQTMNAVVRSKHPEAIIEIKLDHDKKEARVTAKRSKDDVGYEAFWDMNMAKTMGLSHKDNWIKQPMNMLKARALSDALRAVFPDTLLGLYSYEEIDDSKKEKDLSNPAGIILDAMKEDAERIYQEQRKPEDSQYGPLFLIENGIFRGKRLHQVDLFELEDYQKTLTDRKNKKPWENILLGAIDDYVTNQSLYSEQVLELNAE
jgi:hypothetical protein